MEEAPIPFGDEVGLEVLRSLRELGEGLSRLSEQDIGDPPSCSKQFDILQSVNHSIASSRWSQQQQENQLHQSSGSKSEALSKDFPSDFTGPDPDEVAILEVANGNEVHQSFMSESEDVIKDDDDNFYDDADDKNSEESETDEVEDEWDDDDDLGYVAIKISEQEFFEMEEDSAFRLALSRRKEVDPEDDEEEGEVDRLNATTCAVRDHLILDDSLQEDFSDEAESNEHKSQISSEDCYHAADTHVNTTRRRGGASYTINFGEEEEEDADNLAPPPPPQEEADDVSEQSGDSLDYNEEDDIAAVEKELGIPVEKSLQNDQNDCKSESDISAINIEGTSVASLSPPATHSMTTSNKFSIGKGRVSRRISEIMGQKKLRGVDGEHCFFDLKVIFDPFRTGFEESKNFNPPPGTIIAGRYEVMEVLGQAAFSTALQCVDLAAVEDGDEANQWVCLKVIKNSKDFFDQSLDEIKLLQYINSSGDANEHNVLQMIDYFYSKEHLFIVSELLRENLYEFQKYIRESGGKEYFTQNRLKKIMKQILEAMVYIHSLNLLHCDIKPENIVIKSYSRCEVKLIDFGSSCFVTDHLTSYIQSRSYRAPEVILGLDYSYGIDLWSLGGVLAEMHTAYVLFQNDSIASMLCRIEGILGPYPQFMLDTGPESAKYFNLAGIVYERNEEEGSFSLLYPKKTTLRARLHLPPQGEASDNDELFLDFVNQLLQVDPSKRLSATEALQHPWLDGVDDLDVAYNIDDAAPPLPEEDETFQVDSSSIAQPEDEADVAVNHQDDDDDDDEGSFDEQEA